MGAAYEEMVSKEREATVQRDQNEARCSTNGKFSVHQDNVYTLIKVKNVRK